MASEPKRRFVQRWGFYTAVRRTTAVLAAVLWLAMLLFGGANSPQDVALFNWLYAADNVAIARSARFWTQFGTWIPLTAVTLAAAVFLIFYRRRRAALLLVMVFGGRLLEEMQKLIIGRDRPGQSPHLEAVNSMSFPSAHAVNSMITYVAVALLLPVPHRFRAIAVGIAVAISLQIGWSRVALGVHWPSDVVGGWAFATFWIIFCMRMAVERPDAETGEVDERRGTVPGRKPFFIRRRRKNERPEQPELGPGPGAG